MAKRGGKTKQPSLVHNKKEVTRLSNTATVEKPKLTVSEELEKVTGLLEQTSEDDDTLRPILLQAVRDLSAKSCLELNTSEVREKIDAATAEIRSHNRGTEGGGVYAFQVVPQVVRPIIAELIPQRFGKECIFCHKAPPLESGMTVNEELSDQATQLVAKLLKEISPTLPVAVVVGTNLGAEMFAKRGRGRPSGSTSTNGSKKGEIPWPTGTKLVGFYPKGVRNSAEVVEDAEGAGILVHKDGNIYRSRTAASDAVSSHTSGARFWEVDTEPVAAPATA